MAAVVLAATARLAFANGAFPDSFNVLLPADDPQQIILGTNFGLVISGDGGATWEWVCEHDADANGFLYSWTPAGRLLAVSDKGLVSSPDLACSWSTAAGPVSETRVADYFVDPTNPQRV